MPFVDLGGAERRQQDAPLTERQPKCSTRRRRSYLFSFSPDIPSSSANPTKGASLVGTSPFGADLKGVAARIDPSDSCAARPLSGSRQGPDAMNGWRELLTRERPGNGTKPLGARDDQLRNGLAQLDLLVGTLRARSRAVEGAYARAVGRLLDEMFVLVRPSPRSRRLGVAVPVAPVAQGEEEVELPWRNASAR
jgi:hypothetical protein